MTDEPRHRDWAPPRWLRFLLPTVVLIVWLAAAGVGGPTFGKLSSVSTNDQAAFLPASAESTAVIDWQQKFIDAKAIPAIVVIESDTVIPRQELGSYVQLGARFGAVDDVQAPEPPATTTVAGPIPSEDGKAVEFIVPITDQDDVGKVVADLREAADASSPAGTTAYVTGPAGLTADLVSAFGGIDGLLLLVAAGAVLLILFVVYRAVVLPFLVLFTSIFALSWCRVPLPATESQLESSPKARFTRLSLARLVAVSLVLSRKNQASPVSSTCCGVIGWEWSSPSVANVVSMQKRWSRMMPSTVDWSA